MWDYLGSPLWLALGVCVFQRTCPFYLRCQVYWHGVIRGVPCPLACVLVDTCRICNAVTSLLVFSICDTDNLYFLTFIPH